MIEASSRSNIAMTRYRASRKELRMNQKTIGEKPALDHEGAAPVGAASELKTVRVGRFLRNRGTHQLENAVVAKYASIRAHNSVLSPAGMALQLVSPTAQQQIALNAWEDEGGKVRLQAPRAKNAKNSG
jgi:hypothetical protein